MLIAFEKQSGWAERVETSGGCTACGRELHLLESRGRAAVFLCRPWVRELVAQLDAFDSCGGWFRRAVHSLRLQCFVPGDEVAQSVYLFQLLSDCTTCRWYNHVVQLVPSKEEWDDVKQAIAKGEDSKNRFKADIHCLVN